MDGLCQAEDPALEAKTEVQIKKVCPLASLNFYLSKLYESCEAFFQRPRLTKWEASPSWYENSPVGFNTDGAQFVTHTNYCNHVKIM